MSPLKVLRASAGSGKTFSLTMEYLKLLFRSPGIHRHILAVTFTNKAAAEMKQRILGRLHMLSRLSAGDRPDELELLENATGLDIETIRNRSGEMLEDILNDYSRFSVGTIDRFFQSVIRAFTREIGIQPGYNLELDHQRVLTAAVDRLFQDISNDGELQRWLIRFAEERIEEVRSWNFWDEIIDLGGQLFRESFQGLFLEHDISMIGREELEKMRQELEKAESACRQEILHIGTSAMELMASNGAGPSDFKGRDGSVASLFRDASQGADLNFTDARIAAIKDPEKWLNKNSPESLCHLVTERLMPMLNGLYKEQVLLNTIRAIRENYYTLGILGDLWERVASYSRERNLFLLADSGRFLKGIIHGNQVPFIYEQTGNRYSHLMLDEFQDTSLFQYDNFKPLLDNSLAGGNENLVVGDVKQSIYRWRNSDWKILATHILDDFRHQEVKEEQLKRNFRSREQVIRFNNTFFQLASELVAGKIGEELSGNSADPDQVKIQVDRFRHAYSDVVQEIPGRAGEGGLVRIEIAGGEQDSRSEGSDEETASFQDRMLSMIPAWLEEVAGFGIEPGDTAILVRSRREGIRVAARLLQHARESSDRIQFRLISSESLLLVHNHAISLIIAALKYLVFPGDELNNAHLKYLCCINGISTSPEKIFDNGTSPEKIFDNVTLSEEIFDTGLSPDEFLPADFSSRKRLLRQMPLYELIETLITLFNLEERTDDLPYLQALQDLVIDLQRRESTGTAEFLRYWEQHGASKGISLSEDTNAIRILTIHKAKGLEFKAVLVPFCNWEITTDHRKQGILWCNTPDLPFVTMPVLPVKLRSSLKETLFSPAYYQERMKAYMDNLNLLYVAFTRARDLLFIGVPGRKKGALRTTGDLVQATFDLEPFRAPCLEGWSNLRAGNRIETGFLAAGIPGETVPDPWKFITYPVNSGRQKIRIRLRSDDYFVDEEGTSSTAPSYGNIMHLIFSRLISRDDLQPVLDDLQGQGLLPPSARPGLEEEIGRMIVQPGTEKWFSGNGETGVMIHNERSILCGGGTVIRPDRVIVRDDEVIVVDYKFGMVERKEHADQVAEYVRQLHMMGYSGVEGYVWYVKLRKSVKPA